MEGESNNGGALQVEQKADACSNIALEIEDLPNEMLKSILEKLEVYPSHWGQAYWESNFRSLIAYRRVCPTWRDFLDEILEKNLLSTVRAWGPPLHTWDLSLDSISKINFYERTIGIEEKIPCPPSLIGYNGSNPFPAKALELGFKYGCADDDVVLQTQTDIRVIDLFKQIGHHLSILYLNDLRIVDLDVLVNILEMNTNLKVLVLRKLAVSKETSPPPLPALPQLKTLVVEALTMGSTIKPQFGLIPSFSQWLVEPYANQLVQLEIDFPAPLPNLEHFTLTYPDLNVLQQNGPAVPLVRLCVNIEGYQDWKGNIYNVFGYLDQYSKTLVDLFLNVFWSDLIPEASDDDELEGDDQEVQQQGQDPLMEELQRNFGKLPTSKVKFPHLKKLAFPYPLNDMHGMILHQTVLPKFPALEEIIFLHFRRSLDESLDFDQADESIDEFLMRENYWAICRKLLRITVVENDETENDGFVFTYNRCRW